MKCQIKNCNKVAKYKLYWIHTNKTEKVYCKSHIKDVGWFSHVPLNIKPIVLN